LKVDFQMGLTRIIYEKEEKESNTMSSDESKSKDGFQPVGDRVLIKRIRISEEKTASGLYVPKKGKRFENLAMVVAVGDGEKISDHVKPNVHVFVPDDAPSIVMDEELGLHVIGHDSIIGVL